MKFCLVKSNRDAPGPQRWRYMSPASYENCATETITMRASSSEQWKLRPDDEMLIGNNRIFTVKQDKSGNEGKVLHDLALEELGDDLAEEGKPRQSISHPFLEGIVVYIDGKR